MNTKIARRLNQCRREDQPKHAANLAAAEITEAHNTAVANGFIDLPSLDFGETYVEENTISVGIRPKSGIITINDLYNLKGVWGADDINILTGECNAVELVFKK